MLIVGLVDLRRSLRQHIRKDFAAIAEYNGMISGFA
jgi:hypothetical protein